MKVIAMFILHTALQPRSGCMCPSALPVSDALRRRAAERILAFDYEAVISP